MPVIVCASGGIPLQRETIDHPEPQAGANFGAVFGVGDLTGDGIHEFVVSATNQDVGGNTDQGRAYVFSGVDRSLLFTLDTPNPLPAAAFGDAVANVGDVNHDGTPDLIVGAPNFSFGPTASPGQAFVFSGATAALLFVLDDPEPPPQQVSTFFGTAVAGIGDVDGDGYPDLLVGEGQFDGQAFLFSGFDGSLLRKFDNPLPNVVGQFGIEVAALGDVNANGVPDVAMGSTGGRVFVFDGNGDLIRTLENPSPGFFNTFGPGLAPVGDINLDGVTDLLVSDFAGGAPFEGQAFVFSGLDGSVLFRLTNPDPESNFFPFFGAGIAGVGDIDSDGVPDLMVGANDQQPSARQGRASVGRVFLFSGATGQVLKRITGPGPANDFKFFGVDLAGPGDLNGDGIPDILVGESGRDVGENIDQGRVYVYLSNH